MNFQPTESLCKRIEINLDFRDNILDITTDINVDVLCCAFVFI